MNIIEIPFHADMAKAVKMGKKDCTSRNKKYGEPGDAFYIEGKVYVLTRVHRVELKAVAQHLYDREGFSSPEEFTEYWKMLHPRNGWEPERQVWLHEFEVKA